MKTVFIIGVGTSRETLTQEGLAAINSADVLLGAPRLTEMFSDMQKTLLSEYRPSAVLSAVKSSGAARFAVLVSGDVGFFSAADGIADALREYDVRFIPGVSSISCFFAKLKRPWQDAQILSCHGRDANIADAVRRNKLTFALTGGNVPRLARLLVQAGFGELAAFIGQKLGAKDERVAKASVSELSEGRFAPLSVLLVENPRFDARIRFGIPDREFLRGDVPMTKAEVRAITLSKLCPAPNSVCCDIGCGTGSVSVELALAAYKGKVYAIDRNPEAIALTEANAKSFHTGNIITVPGDAAEALSSLPPINAAFIGGSGGQLKAIFSGLLAKNPGVRIVVNAATLETVSAALAAFEENGVQPELVQLFAARARQAGELHMLTAQNPVFIISGGGTSDFNGAAQNAQMR